MGMMSLDHYQLCAGDTALYPNRKTTAGLVYCILGLAGEAGEIANKAKKILRDHNGILTFEMRERLIDELGDVLWYVSQVATELHGTPLEDVARRNLEKLQKRQQKDAIHGEGDNR